MAANWKTRVELFDNIVRKKQFRMNVDQLVGRQGEEGKAIDKLQSGLNFVVEFYLFNFMRAPRVVSISLVCRFDRRPQALLSNACRLD